MESEVAPFLKGLSMPAIQMLAENRACDEIDAQVLPTAFRAETEPKRV
jgi:hypothetical protein